MTEPKPNQQVLVPLTTGQIMDLDSLPPAQREFLRQFFAAQATATAAAMQQQAAQEYEDHPEFFGTSPTDLRRQFSTLPKPRQGAGIVRRNGK